MASSAFASAAAPERSIASINITPLVDVMLVLLVIFMIAAPLMSRAIPLDLPQRAEPPPPPSKVEPITLRIDSAGALFLDGNAIAPSALTAELRSAAAGAGADAPTLQIDASGDADYAIVVRVLAAAKDAGLEKTGLVRH